MKKNSTTSKNILLSWVLIAAVSAADAAILKGLLHL